jgi:membrane-bound serine protease (ClpP class)
MPFLLILLATIAVALLFPSPWNIVVLVVGIGIDAVALVLGLRSSRYPSTTTGMEAMIGRAAQVVDACVPDGTVRIDGELWSARCAAGADAGTQVRILGQKGLVLEVEPDAG